MLDWVGAGEDGELLESVGEKDSGGEQTGERE